MQENNIDISQLSFFYRTFFCKAQVAGQQISSSPTLFAASLNRGGIWSQHMDAKTNTIIGMGIPLDQRIATPPPKKNYKNYFSVKS